MAGIGSTSLIINSRGIFNPLIPFEGHIISENENDINEIILENKIQSPNQSLQSKSIMKIRRQLEIMDMLEDDNDEDWNFVPKKILSHAKRIIPRQVTKEVNNGNVKLIIERKIHMRLQILWKDKTVSWCVADAMRHQNPFIFISYVIKNKLTKDNDFKWVEDYYKNNETSRNIYKIFKTKSAASCQPK